MLNGICGNVQTHIFIFYEKNNYTIRIVGASKHLRTADQFQFNQFFQQPNSIFK
jgi:hypothetical protein